MTITAGPAGVILRARRNVLNHLAGVRATSSDSAVTYQPTQRVEQKALGHLQAREVVRMTQDGRYWLDEAKAAAWRGRLRTRMAVLVGGALAATAAVFAFTR